MYLYDSLFSFMILLGKRNVSYKFSSSLGLLLCTNIYIVEPTLPHYCPKYSLPALEPHNPSLSPIVSCTLCLITASERKSG